MQLVYKHENRAIVFSAKNILEMHGIEGMIKNEHGNTMGAEFGVGNIQLELWVLDDAERERAIEIIDKEIEHPPTYPEWRCPQCKETNAGNFELCWNCQAERPDYT